MTHRTYIAATPPPRLISCTSIPHSYRHHSHNVCASTSGPDIHGTPMGDTRAFHGRSRIAKLDQNRTILVQNPDFRVVFRVFCKFGLPDFLCLFKSSSGLWNCGKVGGFLPSFPSPVGRRWKTAFLFSTACPSGRHFHSPQRLGVQISARLTAPFLIRFDQDRTKQPN